VLFDPYHHHQDFFLLLFSFTAIAIGGDLSPAQSYFSASSTPTLTHFSHYSALSSSYDTFAKDFEEERNLLITTKERRRHV